MPYIGNEVGNRFVASKSASVYSGDGSTTAFTLEHAVGSDEDILVSVDGVIQEPSVAYAVSSGTTLTFTAAPSSNSGNNIFVYYLFRTVATVDHPSTSSLQATDATFSAGVTATTGTFSGAVSAASLDADGGVTVDNITIDGTEIDLSSGDLTVDVAGDITLDADGGDVFFKDSGTEFGRITNSGGMFGLQVGTQDQDLIVYMNDGGSTVEALKLDGSDAGAATLRNGLTLTDGNLVVASGHGIDFSANTGQSGQSSEIFHHYEEGTWTPQVYSNVTQIATSSVYGFYTKVGDLVHINGQVSRNDSASLSSAFLLKNLPFTSKSGTGCVYVNGGFWFDKASATDEVGFGYMSGGSTTVYVKTLNLSAAYITADALENSRPVYFAFTYKTAT